MSQRRAIKIIRKVTKAFNYALILPFECLDVKSILSGMHNQACNLYNLWLIATDKKLRRSKKVFSVTVVSVLE